MKGSLNIVGSVLGLLGLGILIVAIALVFSRPQSSLSTSSPIPSNAQTFIASPYPPPTAPSTTQTLPAPPISTEASPYPGPTNEPPATTTPTPVTILTPLPTYPPPGPFSEMRLMYSKASPPGFYIKSLDGKPEIAITPWWTSQQVGGISSQRVAPDGSKILYSFWDNEAPDTPNAMSIWLSDPDGNNSVLLVTRNDEWYPEDAIWSPDGQKIAYRRAYLLTSYWEGAVIRSQELWIMNADGTNQRLVSADPAFIIETFGGKALIFRWMNNGYIYFVNQSRRLYAIHPETGQLHLLMENADPLGLYKSLSPDGEHIATPANISLNSIQQASLIPIEVDGDVAAWSVDGRFLAYKPYSTDTSKEAGIWLRNVQTGEEQLIVAGETVNPLAFSQDNRFFSYQTSEGIFSWNRETGQSQLVVESSSNPVHEPVQFVAWAPTR